MYSRRSIRQKMDSGILSNATFLRSFMDENHSENFQFDLANGVDIKRMIEGNAIMEALEDAIQQEGLEETVFIVRSNKRANLYNQQIRQRILFLETELSVGDQLMVVKNNYFWLKPESAPGFIANGDLIKIRRVIEHKEIYGFRFAKVEVAMVDYLMKNPLKPPLLDTLSSESPSLSFEEGNLLYQGVSEDYQHLTTKNKRFMAVKNDPYFNALQVKYSMQLPVINHRVDNGKKYF